MRELDEARSRVGEALQRVEDALDVKTCVKGVKQAVEVRSAALLHAKPVSPPPDDRGSVSAPWPAR